MFVRDNCPPSKGFLRVGRFDFVKIVADSFASYGCLSPHLSIQMSM